MQRIDLLVPPRSQYGVLHCFTQDILEAFQRQGIRCRLLVAQRDNSQPLLEALFSDPPDCTFAVNGLLPDVQRHFLDKNIKIPHVACLVDSPIHFSHFTVHPLNIITCPDLFACRFFQKLNFDNVLFMPHGVGKDVAPDPKSKRTFDVVLLASCIDYEHIRHQWKDKYSKSLCAVLDDAAERALSDPTLFYVEAFVQALNDQSNTPYAVNFATINFMEVLIELEAYIRGKNRMELLTAIKDVKVDVFGAGWSQAKWKRSFGRACPNVTCHPPVPYEEAIQIMKQSKIVLHSCAWISNGGHERLFAGMACEALVITNENLFTRKYFEEGKDIVFYRYKHWEEVNELVNTYVFDDKKREAIVKRGRQKVMTAHTWDHRVATLLEQLPPILEKVTRNIE